MNNKMNIPLSGIIPPLVTPLLDDDVLDVEGLQRLIEHLIAGGVHALFVLGTTGESQSLSYKLRVEMIKNTCRIAKGRLPVLVCISDTSIVESVNLACLAADHGADAVVSAPPYYFATGQPELIEFYEHLLPQLPLPLFLYNMPTHTKVSFAPATIRRIAENPDAGGTGRNYGGIRTAGGSWRRKRWCEYVPRIVCELIQRCEECRYGRSETFAGKSNANQCYDIYGRATWVQLPERSEMCSQSTRNMQRLCGCAFP